MPRQFFGTDGIRGVANQYPLVPEQITRIAQAVGVHFRKNQPVGVRPTVLIGKDTRLSGYLIESALMAGFISVGLDVTLVGPLPTPAIAMLTRSMRADLGVVISASHNPYQDNGIKLFGPDGYKLSDAVEKEIEQRIQHFDKKVLTQDRALGQARRLESARERYVEYVKNTIPRGLRFDGLKLVLDCANGANYKIAPKVFWELGAEIVTLANDPNGYNINAGYGATAPEKLIEAVCEHQADLGIAFDGDADRVLLVDERGQLIDGDEILAALAIKMKEEQALSHLQVVGTVMSNLGLEKHLKENDITLLRTPVGDRYVVEKMRETGAPLGGEQSGHIIIGAHTTTGDGLITALQFVDMLVEDQVKASEVGHLFTQMPQVLKNIRVKDASAILEAPSLHALQEQLTNNLSEKGRVLLRKSGTEPIIRVMVEGEDAAQINKVAQQLTDHIKHLNTVKSDCA